MEKFKKWKKKVCQEIFEKFAIKSNLTYNIQEEKLYHRALKLNETDKFEMGNKY